MDPWRIFQTDWFIRPQAETGSHLDTLVHHIVGMAAPCREATSDISQTRQCLGLSGKIVSS